MRPEQRRAQSSIYCYDATACVRMRTRWRLESVSPSPFYFFCFALASGGYAFVVHFDGEKRPGGVSVQAALLERLCSAQHAKQSTRARNVTALMLLLMRRHGTVEDNDDDVNDDIRDTHTAPFHTNHPFDN